MSLLNQASLIQIPSGYKDGTLYSAKPINGDGDFTFSRGSNLAATRVNSEGLIEKGRENLLLQSNQFDTTWTNTNSTETGGQSGYDGTNNAWLLESTSASGHIVQTISASGLQTYSVYAKAGTLNWIRILITASTGNEDRYFNLASGTIGGTTYGPLNSIITSEGNGWYRCSIVYNESTTGVRVYPTSADLDTSGLGNILIQDAQLEQGLVATDYIPTTTTTAQAGILEDMPRLDYSGGASCGSLLLEPQRTNLITQSEYIDSWTKNNTSITANSVTSPDGTQNADTITSTAASPNTLSPLASFASTTNVSIFVKYVSQQWVQLMSGGAVNAYANFDIQNGVIGTVGSNASNAQIENFGNGWYRISVNLLGFTGNTNLYFGFVASGTAGWNTFDPNFNKSLYAWGCQIEASSYATSYIPTYGSSVTRSADSCYKTGISSLIGQSEGVIYIDLEILITNQDMVFMHIYNQSASSNGIYFYLNGSNRIQAFVDNGSIQATITSGILTEGRYKAAFAYKANDFAFYLNGSLVGVDTSGTVPTCNALRLENYAASPTYQEKMQVHQAILFPTRLTNTELADLTTI